MSRVPYAMEEFDAQKTFPTDYGKDEVIAHRIAVRQKVGASWSEFDEIKFFELEDGEEPGFRSESVDNHVE